MKFSIGNFDAVLSSSSIEELIDEKIKNKADLVDGKILISQIPDQFDNVEERYTIDEFPETGNSNTIYIDKNTGSSYRWYDNTTNELTANYSWVGGTYAMIKTNLDDQFVAKKEDIENIFNNKKEESATDEDIENIFKGI